MQHRVSTLSLLLFMLACDPAPDVCAKMDTQVPRLGWYDEALAPEPCEWIDCGWELQFTSDDELHAAMCFDWNNPTDGTQLCSDLNGTGYFPRSDLQWLWIDGAPICDQFRWKCPKQATCSGETTECSCNCDADRDCFAIEQFDQIGNSLGMSSNWSCTAGRCLPTPG